MYSGILLCFSTGKRGATGCMLRKVTFKIMLVRGNANNVWGRRHVEIPASYLERFNLKSDVKPVKTPHKLLRS